MEKRISVVIAVVFFGSCSVFGSAHYQISSYPETNSFQRSGGAKPEQPSTSKSDAQKWWEAYHPGQTYPEQAVKPNENKNELENAADKEKKGE